MSNEKETTMLSKDELESIVFAAFHLGVRMMREISDEEMSNEVFVQKMDAALKGVASGEVVLGDPGSLSRQFPELGDKLDALAAQRMLYDRKLAEMVIRNLPHLIL